jgi:aminopeptidase N
MKKLLMAGISLVLLMPAVKCQVSNDLTYRGSADLINNLVHTRLAVRFDYVKKYLYGKAWITLHPHFYPTDSLKLDAKGMTINEVSIIKDDKPFPLDYKYDGKYLNIHLDRVYTAAESYLLFIDYISKPDELGNAGGSAAIISSKGLYFINPDGKEADKPIEIWTQGETEANSVWFPTIDKPNQKTTSEIAITVDEKYVTLSNGKLASQKNNSDHTRTDTWVMDLPHAPYLFMMAVGDFRVYKDSYKGLEVSYYLEPKFAPFAKQIFGNTPEMIQFFESITGVAFPWNKYAQIVCRDYVAGAMENTTATLHGEYVHRTDRDLLDADPEDFISHELFHQWFGDLVTCESWSNITLNESFADYSEFLWFEHKYGADRAGECQYNAMQQYFNLADFATDGNLVRFYYNTQEDLFDNISYQKGGRILHMLRHIIGDSAFDKSLNVYLTSNSFKTAEVPEWRLAIEEVTGKDMNWFFNQWYYEKGYPLLDISYRFDKDSKIENVIVQQKYSTPSPFILPFSIDIYSHGKKERLMVTLNQKDSVFSFPCQDKPDLVDVDAEKILLAKISDHKSLQEYIFQYKEAGSYMNRREAIENCLKNQESQEEARTLLEQAVKDAYYGLRILAIDGLDITDKTIAQVFIPLLKAIADSDPKSTVRAAAIQKLGKLKNKDYKGIFLKAMESRSYAEQGAGLLALGAIDLDQAYSFAEKNQTTELGGIEPQTAEIFRLKGNEADLPFFKIRLKKEGPLNLNPANQYKNMLLEMKNTSLVEKGLDDIKEEAFANQNAAVAPVFVQILDDFIVKKKARSASAKNPSEQSEMEKQAAYAKDAEDQVKARITKQ